MQGRTKTVITMTKKKSSIWEKATWLIPLTGVIALIGATMNIFGVPYGYEIGISSAMWFAALFCVAIIAVAAKEYEKERKEKKKELVKDAKVAVRRANATKKTEVQAG